VVDGLHAFREHMAQVAGRVSEGPAPAKVQRFVRMHEAGLPLDITVRWYPADALEEMEQRVGQLTAEGRQAWISQGLAWDSSLDHTLASVERKTDLLKGLESVHDFWQAAVPRLRQWEKGSWAKLYYDTPARSLVGGTIGFDTNRFEGMPGKDARSARLEAASGISDVRDLHRQMTAQHVLVGYSDKDVFSQIRSALGAIECVVEGVAGLEGVIGAVREMAPGEPRVAVIDGSVPTAQALQLVADLKDSPDTAHVPLIVVLPAGEHWPLELLARVSGAIQLPLSTEEIRASVFMTGFRLAGDAYGFKMEFSDILTRREVERLLSRVMGVGGGYRRMMMRLANLEARPTIAFEFKLVPIAPYEFFFLDYEWSGAFSLLHRFDWLYSYAVG
jgi:hypothetical protein